LVSTFLNPLSLHTLQRRQGCREERMESILISTSFLPQVPEQSLCVAESLVCCMLNLSTCLPEGMRFFNAYEFMLLFCPTHLNVPEQTYMGNNDSKLWPMTPKLPKCQR